MEILLGIAQAILSGLLLYLIKLILETEKKVEVLIALFQRLEKDMAELKRKVYNGKEKEED